MCNCNVGMYVHKLAIIFISVVKLHNYVSLLCKQVIKDLITVGECCTLELTEFEKCVDNIVAIETL